VGEIARGIIFIGMIKLKHILQEISESEYQIISGADFKRKYLTTSSEQLERANFEGNHMNSMGSVLGRGMYFSVSQDSSDHYESDDYYSGTDYYDLLDSAKIMLVPKASEIGGQKIEQIANKMKADGVYDPTEGEDSPYLGLVIYNQRVVR